ncbi:hypothetical protein SERLA73DRAFT_119583 [Serpula lacrymans var. lacrymans S7.3]|uniref:cystathionine gamma-synthase n=2 Tax=Serpula lacrymans var. lacrymans TaxID=341189 RepID=F8PL84_SERL3|nr:uncharacterized protein SERLADRAFT_365904 [Serpula lacrymans var. lacrymans S7.9]EGO03992.1 hypothetical protein SERLA73DRAFT_119583 [Serpula lacrymans var. lacrymans S7.3]EGO29912.1 hypothetical protein SERLADRAFT_365904 [Serpula lacrymans var. lacrymans S7.9]
MSPVATLTAVNNNDTLGLAVPPFTPHAISVSLPTWRDNVEYEAGDKRVIDVMVSGYPRFFIHLSIQKLARICEQKFGVKGELCLLCPSKKVADHCRAYIIDRSSRLGAAVPVRLVQYLLCPEDTSGASTTESNTRSLSQHCVELHIVLFPADAFPLAKQFWQHSGLTVSSRLAEHCLSLIPEAVEPPKSPRSPTSPVHSRSPFKALNKHYSVKSSPKIPQVSPASTSPPPPHTDFSESLTKDQDTYVEERYGRNLPVTAGEFAKRALRRRIAGVLVSDDTPNNGASTSEFCAGAQDVEVGPSSRGVREVAEDDVYLFPTGMAAIWNAHQLALNIRPPAKSVCFGFPYTDTLKILEKWGPGCHFLGRGLDEDIDTLEQILEEESRISRPASTPPITALFTEFPSNPLLRCANLPRLRALADKYDFLLVVDETIGNFVNVEVLPFVDIVVSSLSKIFSGDANVMGGSLVLNPAGRHYSALKRQAASSYEDLFFIEDAVFMERNSRDFKRRVRIIDSNTEAVCDFLRSRSVAGGYANSPAINEVYYPKWIARENYELCRIKDSSGRPDEKGGGFGGLFSLDFTSDVASRAFFDALPCYKGPSLGTNFTLACPYTVLAHFTELQWASEYGVDEGLVRISVGMEERGVLLRSFEVALNAAESATR